MKRILSVMLLALLFMTTSTIAGNTNPSVQNEILKDTSALKEVFIATADQCKFCFKKIKVHQANMDNSKESEAVLKAYKDNLLLFCGPLMSTETKLEAQAAALKRVKANAKVK